MTDITAFLAARLDEDERYAHAASGLLGIVKPWYAWAKLKEALPGMTRADCRFIEHQSPARVLAEIAAKRLLIKHLTNWAYLDPENDEGYDAEDIRLSESHETSLKLLATPYADHPDYKPEWRIDGT